MSKEAEGEPDLRRPGESPGPSDVRVHPSTKREKTDLVALIESIQSGRLFQQYAASTPERKSKAYFALNRFLSQIRDDPHEGPMWSSYRPSPETALHRFRVNGTLELHSVDETRLSPSARQLLVAYKDNISEFGNDGIAHLCLRGRIFRTLTKEGVQRLSQIPDVLNPEHSLAFYVWGSGFNRYPSPGVEINRKLRELTLERSSRTTR